MTKEPPEPPEPPQAPQARSEPTLAERVRAAPVTFALTLVNVVVFVIDEASGNALLEAGLVEPRHVWAGEYWRLATHMFLHLGWMHLIWNTYASIGWCTAVERALGHRRFLDVYLLSGLAGGAASTVLLYNPSAGASGAMFGIVGATLALRRRALPSFAATIADRQTRATLFAIAIWTAIGATALHVNHRAHFGGLAAGAIATWIFTAPSPRARRVAWAVFAAAFAALLVLATRPWMLAGARAASAARQVHDDAETAAIERRCGDGDHPACFALDLTMPESAGDTTRDHEPFCERGDEDACAARGWALSHGRPGVARDEPRGRALMAEACAKGSAWGCALAKGAPPAAGALALPAPPK